MKRLLPFLTAALIVGLIVSTLWFLYSKSRPKPPVVETEKPAPATIVRKTVASGAIEPRKEVELKPKVAGILRKLFVKPGDLVKRGDVVGEVQIIVDPVGLNEAELRLRSAVLREQLTKQELDRIKVLVEKGTFPPVELDRALSQYQLAEEETVTSRSRVQLLRAGTLKQAQGAPTRIESTVDGTVLSIPVKEGSSVINANSFNPGTTVAFVADMGDMLFKGTVDESEVGKLEAGMPVQIVIGALNDLSFDGVLQFVAPKKLMPTTGTSGGGSAATNTGTTEFQIEASFQAPSGVTVRAGYSANANIVLERREGVLAISESFLIFEKGNPFVDVQRPDGSVERRAVKLGLSDGLKVEVLGGVSASDTLRKPLAAP